ncbi:hypothetical protein, partial [Salmonella sp. SAL4444]|uniref:hypothetical protein n=1 Tax=Salmonella sp. SAL4444 TaxID=3159899 RepID=UPI0039795F7C
VNTMYSNFVGFLTNFLKEQRVTLQNKLPDATVEKVLEYGVPPELVQFIDDSNCGIFFSVRFHVKAPPMDYQILKYAYDHAKTVAELDV